MAIDTQGGVVFYLSLTRQHKEFLGSIRHWANIKLAYEEEIIWLKGFTTVQLDSVEVKIIPYKKLYYTHGAKLFLKDSLLPEKNIPSLLWTSIDRGLVIELPGFNHNYFGLQNTVPIKLLPSDKEREAQALLVNVTVLEKYMITAPAVRFKNLKWVMLDQTKVLMMGTPLLPLDGETYWLQDSFLVPSGYQLEFEILSPALGQLINQKNDHWVTWNKNGTYSKIQKEALAPLSLSSFRLTIKGMI